MELFVVADGFLDIQRLEHCRASVPGSVARQFQDLGRYVLSNGSKIHGRSVPNDHSPHNFAILEHRHHVLLATAFVHGLQLH